MGRIFEVQRVFTKHLIGFLFDQIRISRAGHKRILREEEVIPTVFQRVRLALEELGPSFVKLGQVLSTRKDILPADLIEELQKLQEDATPFPYEEARQQIKANVGAEIEEIFDQFEPTPIASASIGQVYHAYLKSGEEVIVKVQRPGIRAKVEADISVMTWGATVLEKYFPAARVYNLLERVREFGRFIREEMDYLVEARYCDVFRKNFENDEHVYIPKVYWEYTNSKILVMEYVHGIRARDLEALERAGYDRVEVAKTIGRAYAKMILEDGFFHADPHPGNIFVQGSNKFALIDFGMVGRLDKETKGYVAHYFLALVNQDAPALTEILFRLYKLPRDVDRQALKRDVGRLMAKYYGVSLGSVNIGEIVNDLMEIIYKYKIIVPGEFTLFDKTFVTLDGIGKQLAPEFDLLEEAVPFANRFIRSQFSLRELAPTLIKDAFEIKDALINLPRQVNKLMYQLENGDFQVRVEQEKLHNEVRHLSQTVETLHQRFPMGILVATFLMAGTLLLGNSNQPIIWDVSLFGWMYFGAALTLVLAFPRHAGYRMLLLILTLSLFIYLRAGGLLLVPTTFR